MQRCGLWNQIKLDKNLRNFAFWSGKNCKWVLHADIKIFLNQVWYHKQRICMTDHTQICTYNWMSKSREDSRVMRCKKTSVTPVNFMKLKLRLEENSLKGFPSKNADTKHYQWFWGVGWGNVSLCYPVWSSIPKLSWFFCISLLSR